MAAYHPSDHQDNKEGRLVLVNEENGNEVGEVNSYHVHAIGVTPGSKGMSCHEYMIFAISHGYDIDIKADPVEIQLPEDQQGTVTVSLAKLERLSVYSD